MKNIHIRWVVFLGTLSILGIIFTQVYWVQKAVENRQEEFNHHVQMALRNVVESLCVLNGNDFSNDPIDQVSLNYFIAQTNNKIDLESLDYLIKAELEKRSIQEDFEYGVYDCSTDRMVYGDFISMSNINQTKPQNKLPLLEDDEYYFGVYFPGRSAGYDNEMGIWRFTTFVTVILVLFFGYALFIILRQKRLSEIQRDFINNMTHEFKTPLSTLKLSSEALKSEVNSDRGRRYIDIIEKESERLQNHIGRLLSTNTKVDRVRLVSLNLNLVCEQTFKTISPEDNKGWALTLTDANPIIIADLELMEAILFNLLENAKKYGGGNVSLVTRVEKNKVWIDISNNGSQIPQNEQQKIFQKFYRISQGDRHDVKGFGLGLPIVRDSLKLLKGKISVVSANGNTTFTIKLPLG